MLNESSVAQIAPPLIGSGTKAIIAQRVTLKIAEKANHEMKISRNEDRRALITY